MNYKFKNIELECFRGYKEKQVFDFTLAEGIANLIVIYAPNGFGKTSFFDAIEWGFSGKISRLSNNKKVKDVADEEKGYIIKNREFGEHATIGFTFEHNPSQIVINSKKVGGVRKRDDVEGDIVSGEELFQTINGNLFINNNVLTHDQVDSFLRFTSSKEKYNALKTFWDSNNDTEVYKNILVIKKELEKKSENYEKELIGLNNDLVMLAPSENIINHINKLVTFYDGNISEIEFKIENIDQFIIDWNQRKTSLLEMENSSEKQRIMFYSLNHRYDLEYTQAMLQIDNDKTDSLKLNELIKNFQRKTQLSAEINIIDETIKKSNNRLADYRFIINNLDNYLILSEELHEMKNKELELNQFLVKNTNDLNTQSENFKEFNILIDSLNQKHRNYSNALEKVNEIMKKIAVMNKDLFYNKRISQVKVIILNLENEFQKLSYQMSNNSKYFQMNISELLSLQIADELQAKGSIIYEECKKIHKTRLEIQEVRDKKKNNLVRFEEMGSSLENLVILGTQIIIDSKVNSCPLCKEPYSDFNKLLDKIKGTSDIFEIEELSKEILVLDTEILRLDESLNEKTIDLNNYFESELRHIRNKTNTIENHLSYFRNKNSIYRQRLSEVMKDIEIIDQFSIEHNLQITKDKDLKIQHLLNIQNSVSNSLSSVRDKIEEYQKEKFTFEKKYSEITHEIEHIRLLIDQNKLLINGTLENSVYKKVNEHISDNNISKVSVSANITSIIEKVIEELMILTKKSQSYKEEIRELDLKLGDYYEYEIINEFNELENKIDKNKTITETYKNDYLRIMNTNKINKDDIKDKLTEISSKIESIKNNINTAVEILSNLETLNNNNSWKQKKSEKEVLCNSIELNNKLIIDINSIRELGKKHIEEKITNRLNLDAINKVYQMINPHPKMKHISIELDDSEEEQLGLNIYTLNVEKDIKEAPILYFSSAQVNMLSLSIFLAGALEEQGEFNTIFMDDPIQHLDGINLLSFIDLLRIITTSLDRQVVISTHDERFYKLVSRKIDPQYFKSKFIELETFGKLK